MNGKKNDDFNPFGEFGEEPDGDGGAGIPPEDPKPPVTKKPKKKKKKTSPARKIAYTAVGTALAVVMITLTCYLPLTVAPLVMISLCYNIVTERCGVGYGAMSALASVGLGFLICAANIGVMLIVVVVFVPYSLVCVFIRRLDYSDLKKTVLRLLIIAAFASLVLFFVFLLGSLVVDYAPVGEMIGRFGSFGVGYFVVTLVFVALFVCVDWIYVKCVKLIVPKLK